MEENYYRKFINFFKSCELYNKEVFDYIFRKSILYNYLEVECCGCTGIYYILDKNNKLLDFNIVVPFIDSEKTLFINIHEYMHAIDAYYKLGRKVKIDETTEVISLLFEKLYLSEVNNEKLNNYQEKLNEIRNNSDEQKYILGAKIADEILIYYNKDVTLKDLHKKSKKLLRKYKYLK